MSSPEIIFSRILRRGIFWVLLSVAVLGPAFFVVIVWSESGVFLGFDGSELLQTAGGAIALLLVWCAFCFRVEPVLARCALIYIAILHILLFAGLAAPVY